MGPISFTIQISQSLGNHYMKTLYRYLCLVGVITYFFTLSTYANSSYGDIAHSAMGPISGITKLIRVVCAITGVGLFFSGCVKFSDWRRNPVEVTFGLVLALILSGLALIGLALLPEMFRWV